VPSVLSCMSIGAAGKLSGRAMTAYHNTPTPPSTSRRLTQFWRLSLRSITFTQC
jgi:hypothetical protein